MAGTPGLLCARCVAWQSAAPAQTGTCHLCVVLRITAGSKRGVPLTSKQLETAVSAVTGSLAFLDKSSLSCNRQGFLVVVFPFSCFLLMVAEKAEVSVLHVCHVLALYLPWPRPWPPPGFGCPAFQRAVCALVTLELGGQQGASPPPRGSFLLS